MTGLPLQWVDAIFLQTVWVSAITCLWVVMATVVLATIGRAWSPGMRWAVWMVVLSQLCIPWRMAAPAVWSERIAPTLVDPLVVRAQTYSLPPQGLPDAGKDETHDQPVPSGTPLEWGEARPMSSAAAIRGTPKHPRPPTPPAPLDLLALVLRLGALLWLGGVLWLLARLALGFVLMQRWLAHARPVSDPVALAILREAEHALGLASSRVHTGRTKSSSSSSNGSPQ